MIKGYIIDFGGTLDTNGCHWGRFLWHAFERRQVPVSWEEFREAYVHVERLLGKGDIIKPDYTLQQTLSIKIRLEMQHLVGRGYWYSTPLEQERYHTDILLDVYSRVGEQIEQSHQLLTSLSAQAPVVLCSNYYGNLNAVLQEFHLDGLFAAVIESAAVGIRKPDAAIYEQALQPFGGPSAAPEVMVIGDDTEPSDVRSFLDGFRDGFASGKSAALVVKKGALTYDLKADYYSCGTLTREKAV